MARFLKQSTSVDVPIGPFVDATDGITAETGLTLTQPDIRLKKNGGAWAQKAAAQTLSHEENGFYEVTLDATDTNTLGLLRLAVFESGAAPVWEDFMVVTANVYDSLFSTDVLDVSVTQFGGTNGTFSGGRPEVNTSHWAGTAVGSTTVRADVINVGGSAVSASSGLLNANVTQISGDSTAADRLENSFDDTAGSNHWTGVVDQGTAQSATSSTLVLRAAAAFADDELIGATILITGGSTGVGQSRVISDYAGATDTATVSPNWTTDPSGTITYKIFASARPSSTQAAEIADAVWEETLADHSGTVGSTAEALDAAGGGVTAAEIADAVWDEATTGHTTSGTFGEQLKTDVDAILVDTGTTLDGKIDTIDTNVDAILVDTGTTLDGKLDTIDTNVDAILADTAVIGTPAGASVSADIAAIKSETASILTDTGTTLDGKLDTIDTVVDAIKTKTDSLTFTVANVVDANIQRVNDVAITGDGSGTPFGV